ncbi:hypothetical protein ACFQ1S_42420, partial [Kibdelosporangium lantanae]
DGVVRLLGARIGGRLDCTGARLSNDDGPALVLDGVRVEENVFLGSLVATGSGAGGTVSLGNATFGSLDCVGARMYNGSGPALNAADLTVAGNVFLDRLDAVSDGENVTLNFAGTVVKGQFEFSPARVEHRAHRSQRLWLDGLTYNGLPVGVSPSGWVRLISEATPTYTPQPYQQLAAAHRALGHDREARYVLIGQRRDQIR